MSKEVVSNTDESLEDVVRSIVREEVDTQPESPSATRRQVLGALGAGGVAGLLGGAGSAAANTGVDGTAAALGEVAPGVYKWADPGGFAGPDAGKSNVTHDTGQLYVASDTGTVYYDGGASWTDLGLGSGGSTVYLDVSSYPGANLDDKVDNAVTDNESNYGGQATLYVPHKSDGSDWTWASDISLDYTGDDYGLDLVVGWNVHIVYSGTGSPLTIDSSGGSGINTEAKSRIVGGIWDTTGSATGWLRVIDSFQTVISPNRVLYQEGYGVELRNEDQWTESTRFIGGEYRTTEGFRFIPANAPDAGTITTGGTGTNSFHDTSFCGVQVSASDYCIRAAGVYQYIDHTVTLQTDSSGSSLLYLDAERMEATTFHSTKFESPANPGDVAAAEYGPSMDAFYGPKLDNARQGFGVDIAIRGSPGTPLPHNYAYGGDHVLGFVGGSNEVTVDKDGTISADGDLNVSNIDLTDFNANLFASNYMYLGASGSAFQKISPSGVDFARYNPSDLSGSTGSQQGEVQMDDGTNTTHGDPDLCVWNGSAWRQSGTTTTFT